MIYRTLFAITLVAVVVAIVIGTQYALLVGDLEDARERYEHCIVSASDACSCVDIFIEELGGG